MAKSEKDFITALRDKNVPILTLDHNWHQVFGQGRLTPEIADLEEAVNHILKRQGKMNTEIKKVKALKKKLMGEIVEIADQLNADPEDASLEKDLDEHKRLMAECDEKMDELKDEGMDIPRELKEANDKLMLATMQICYERFGENTEEINEISEWIKSIKVELKQRVISKQDKEVDNYNMYTYMQEVFGADTLKLFEMSYNPAVHPPKKKNSGVS